MSRQNWKERMRAVCDEYGQIVHRAVDYILDDKDAFRTVLSNARIDMHDIDTERLIRAMVMGRLICSAVTWMPVCVQQ